jgi:hypothetical protein
MRELQEPVLGHAETNTEVKRDTYIYVAAGNGYVKAGISIDPPTRLANVWGRATMSPNVPAPRQRMEILGTVKSGYREEFNLHELLSVYRVPGTKEWYFDSPDVRSAALEFLKEPWAESKPIPAYTEGDDPHVISLDLTDAQRAQGEAGGYITLTAEQERYIKSAFALQYAEASKGASGRPRVARCVCGKYSLARAAYRGHKCA